MNYYERHIGDYLKDTTHLSLLEHGVYGRLLDIYYVREGPIPADQAARLVAARSKDEQAALEVVLEEFFDLAGECWTHKRCDEEIARYKAKSAQAQRAALASVASRQAAAQRALDTGSTDVVTDVATDAQRGLNVPSNQTPVTIRDNTLTGCSSPSADLPGIEPAAQKGNGAYAPPDCPHEAIVKTWAEVLPALPQPTVWKGARVGHLRARWREVATDEHWTTQAQGIEFFRNLFALVGRSAFLTGRVKSRNDGRTFQADLPWLVRPENFLKVIDGKYNAH